MSRLSVVALPCVLAIASASCRVYDSELLEFAAGGRAVHVNANSQVLDAALDAEPVIIPACGNGHVEGRERCDIAIAQGEPGACPEACEMRDGCLAYQLAGQRCGARCTPIEITESVPDDGCCPTGATPDTDSDCSAQCGNGMVEQAETCDPPESCPNQESCHTTKACMTAHLTGAAGTCSAHCQELPIEVCKSGDGCCPDGCAAAEDDDCKAGAPTPPSTMTTEAGTANPETKPTCTEGPECTAEQMQSECTMVHSGGPCHACDCTHCASNVAACEAATKDTGACSRVVECALQNHCQGIACLCGANVGSCPNRPLGPCLWEIRDLAGSRDYYDILWTASTPGTPLAIAMNLVQCRADHCAETCGL
ncbi:MAG TPA: hypothetical protein VFN67_11940 [Polyangiales bacterium]|nr:hypothetical protein [Polyangiales bacterium]